MAINPPVNNCPDWKFWLGTVLTTVLAILGFKGKGFIRWQRRHRANIELHNTFAPAIVEIKNAPENSTGENMNIIKKIIGGSIEQHAIAVERFRFFLDGDERISFDSAWEKYSNGYDDGHGYEYSDIANADGRIGCRRLALERINKILQFTKH